VIYMDNAATAWPRPAVVAREMARVAQGAFGNPGRGSHAAARASAHVLLGAREALANHLGCPLERLLLTPGCTWGLNMALLGLRLRGGHVISTTHEHNALLRPLWRLMRRGEISLTLLPPEGLMTALEGVRRPNTRLVALAHGSNVTGELRDVEAIGAWCRSRGIWLAVDGAQTVGHLRYDLAHQPIDVLAFCGHKGLRGPMGTGGLYVREGLALEPVVRGGTGGYTQELDPPDDWPDGYEPGTPNVAGMAGLAAAVGWIDGRLNHEAAHAMAMAHRLAKGLRGLRGVRVIGDPQLPVVAMVHNAHEPVAIGEALDRRGICVRTGFQCAPLIHREIGAPQGVVRFSPGSTTTAGEVDTCVAAVWGMK